MANIKVYNRIQLREHPDASPSADATFSKSHSFIFPGDEIVFCGYIDSAKDIPGINEFKNSTLTAIKMSVIAKKPNIYTEEFSKEYSATKSFELDSVTIPINSTNAPVVPWGFDGYAPNLNVTQDRSWNLPSGDFRRQIKLFTTHTVGYYQWQYNFYFPVIFREEYWQALIAADNDFYDPLQPQDGKNHKWLRYHNLSAMPFGWMIKFRVELSYDTISTATNPPSLVPNKIISELNLSNENTGIQDYESNTDYSLTEIKTGRVGQSPTTDRFIYGGENTECYGYFTKQTAWDAGEKDKLTAIFRIRPKEGGGRIGDRTSTAYITPSTSVWDGDVISNLLLDNSFNILIDGGDNLLLDGTVKAITISFDPLDDKNVIVKATIDYTKLTTTFPNINNFTLYCRLYNGTKKVLP